MTATSIIQSAPYYSAHDPDLNRVQILFNPGRAVQSRELTELQTILQHQISTMAGHVFADGSRVTGGEVVRKKVRYYKLEPQFFGVEIDPTEWVGKRITERVGAEASGMTGTVMAYTPGDGDRMETIYVEHDSETPKESFSPGASLFADGVQGGATVASEGDAPTGMSMHIGLSDGVYHIEGRFVHVPAGMVIAEAYSDTPSGTLGVVYDGVVVTPRDDDTLRDTARGSPNYNAPGADRLAFVANPSFVPEGDEVPDRFVAVAEIADGEIRSVAKGAVYADIGAELARRTYDESGDYTVEPFDALFDDHIGVRISSVENVPGGISHRIAITTATDHLLSTKESVTVEGVGGDPESYNGVFPVEAVLDSRRFEVNLDSTPTSPATVESAVVKANDDMTLTVGPGKAYVMGFEIEKGANTPLRVPKARTSTIHEGYAAPAPDGLTLLVEPTSGSFDHKSHPVVSLRNSNDEECATARVFSRTTSGSLVVMHIHSLKAVTGKTASAATKVRIGDFEARVSNLSKDDNGNTVARGEGLGFVVRLPEESVVTLAPGGTPSVDLVESTVFEASVSNLGFATFTVAGNRRFTGPYSRDFASTFEDLGYSVFDMDTGEVIPPRVVTVESGATEIRLTLPQVSRRIAFVAPVRVVGVGHRHKSRTRTEVTVAHDEQVERYDLDHPDGLALVSVRGPGDIDLTDKFTFDGGQRDDFYDHAAIDRISPLGVPDGSDLVVEFDHYTHTGTGFFSVDSYPEDENPSYVSDSTGIEVDLTNCVDFRPTRESGSTNLTGATTPTPGTAVTADVEFYLPRRDRIVLDSTGSFRNVTGEPSLSPRLPPEPSGAMTLYESYVPARTSNPSDDVQIKHVDNRRYTMRDLGKIDRRVDRLEKYTALSLLELETKTTQVTDSDGYDRFKNGFLVDDFSGHGVGDVSNLDYRCSVDFESRELRPAFTSESASLEYTSRSTGVSQVGNDDVGYLATVPHTARTFVEHAVATKSVSVNPYLVTREEGVLRCNPPSDDWVDTSRRPAVKVDLSGDQAAWRFMEKAVTDSVAPGFGTRWRDWQTTWTGVSSSVDTDVDRTRFRARGRDLVETRATSTTTRTTTRRQVRRGDVSTLGFESISKSVGDRVVDVNLARFMRPVEIKIHGFNLRPRTDLHCFVDETKVNAHVTPTGARHAPVGEGCIRTDEDGEVRAVLRIPAGMFRTGDRDIVLIDEPNKVVENARTYAAYVFSSSGLLQTKQKGVVSTRAPMLSSREIVENRTVVDVAVENRTSVTVSAGGRRDPLAQTFYVPSSVHPHGVFIHSVDLFMKRKPMTGPPLEVQIRPVVNGFPHSSRVLPLGQAAVLPKHVNIPENTNDMTSVLATPTRIDFPAPVYLMPGEEYALIVISDSSEYECYVAEMGRRILGKDVVVSKQPSLGSLFKSQNSSTWTPTQNEDLTMRINRCEFDTGRESVVVCDGFVESRANLAHLSTSIIDFPVACEVKSEIRMSFSGGGETDEWRGIEIGVDKEFSTEMVASASKPVTVRTTMSTSRNDVAPLLDLSRHSVVLVHNLVNDDAILRENLAIEDPGTGYTTATVVVEGAGVGAQVEPVVSDGRIVDLVVVSGGSGYGPETVLTVTGDGTGASVSPPLTEESVRGGGSLARYITRRTSLSDEWTSDFATVTLDAYIPPGTEVRAYAKYASADDPKPFESRPWVRMERNGGLVFSGNPDDFRELTFTPVGGTLSYEDEGAVYESVKSMAVKIVLASSNSSVIPRARDLRVVWAAP